MEIGATALFLPPLTAVGQAAVNCRHCVPVIFLVVIVLMPCVHLVIDVVMIARSGNRCLQLGDKRMQSPDFEE